MDRRKIAVFTGNRAEYGLLEPVIRALSQRSALEVYLLVSGSHLLEEFGMSVMEIDRSLVKECRHLPLSDRSDNKHLEALSSFASLVKGGSRALEEIDPECIVLAGDRSESFAMAVSAFYMNIPIAHLFGGDLSLGGHRDDSARHSITKLAHLHFTSSDDAYQRVLRLGEEDYRVFNVGSTSIDNIISGNCLPVETVAEELGIDRSKRTILFTQHPVTTESDQAGAQLKESMEALKDLGEQTVITYPCNDPGSEEIIDIIQRYRTVPHFVIRKNLGWKRYLGLMKMVSVVVGNSSSGIIECPALKIPFVHVGTRQAGRLRSENVIDVPYERNAIKEGILTALTDTNFLERVRGCANPYGNGDASEKIADTLNEITFDQALLQKKLTY